MVRFSCAASVVGDGINDGPALADADLGMAIGLFGRRDRCRRHHLGRDHLDVTPCATTWQGPRCTVKHGLGHSDTNIAAIPVAAAGLLQPLVAGTAMALSSFFVVSNSFAVRKFGRYPLGCGTVGGPQMTRRPA